MESVRRARARVRQYPTLLVECAPMATAYAKCVLTHPNLSKGDCEETFQAFHRCMREAAKRASTRL